MATIELTKDNFASTIENNEIVILDFWASSCGPCKDFGPVFEQASEKHTDVAFGKVDTEAQAELATAFNIRSIPTVMVFRDQIGLLCQPGAMSEEMLEKVIEQVKQLDMDQVREEVAKQATQQGCGCNCSCEQGDD